MTPDQKKQVARIGEELKEIFPDFYGSIKFNLTPKRSGTNINLSSDINIEQSMKLNPNQ